MATTDKNSEQTAQPSDTAAPVKLKVRESLIRRGRMSPSNNGEKERAAALVVLRALTEAGQEPRSVELLDREVKVTMNDESTAKAVSEVLKAVGARVAPHNMFPDEFYISHGDVDVTLTQSPFARIGA